MKQWHGCVERQRNPKWQRAFEAATGFNDGGFTSGSLGERGSAGVNASGYSIAKELLAPMPKEEQPCRNRIKPSTLRHEHRQRNAFPGDLVNSFIIRKLPRREKLEASYSAVEQESCNGKCTAPAIKRVKGCERRNQSAPDQAVDQVHVDERQQRIEQIDTCGVPQFAKDVDGIVGPERYTARKVFDQREVQ